jgi:integral membrane protein
MTIWVAFRILKWAGLLLFGAGCLGSAVARDARDRASFAYGVGTAGWLISWIAGYGLAKSSGVSIGEPWITAGMGFSFLALLGAVFRAQGFLPAASGGLSVGAAISSVAVMALRADPLAHAWSAGLGLAAGVVTGGLLAVRSEPAAPPDVGAARTWFDWLARLEGLSLLALFGIFMPAKYALHVELDGGQGWFGWVHGMLFVSYLVALIGVSRVAGWSLLRTAAGFVASLLPFGTFVFEARTRDDVGLR